MMARRDLLLHAIAQDQQHLSEAVTELRGAVEHRFDFRQRIAQRPYLWICRGFALGLLLGMRADKNL